MSIVPFLTPVSNTFAHTHHTTDPNRRDGAINFNIYLKDVKLLSYPPHSPSGNTKAPLPFFKRPPFRFPSISKRNHPINNRLIKPTSRGWKNNRSDTTQYKSALTAADRNPSYRSELRVVAHQDSRELETAISDSEAEERGGSASRYIEDYLDQDLMILNDFENPKSKQVTRDLLAANPVVSWAAQVEVNAEDVDREIPLMGNIDSTLMLLDVDYLTYKLAETVYLSQQPLAVVVERIACSPPTNAHRIQYQTGSLPTFRMWESGRTMSLVGGCSRGYPVSPPLHSGAPPYLPQSPSSALKTSLLRAAQISSLTFSLVNKYSSWSRANLRCAVGYVPTFGVGVPAGICSCSRYVLLSSARIYTPATIYDVHEQRHPPFPQRSDGRQRPSLEMRFPSTAPDPHHTTTVNIDLGALTRHTMKMNSENEGLPLTSTTMELRPASPLTDGEDDHEESIDENEHEDDNSGEDDVGDFLDALTYPSNTFAATSDMKTVEDVENIGYLFPEDPNKLARHHNERHAAVADPTLSANSYPPVHISIGPLPAQDSGPESAGRNLLDSFYWPDYGPYFSCRLGRNPFGIFLVAVQCIFDAVGKLSAASPRVHRAASGIRQRASIGWSEFVDVREPHREPRHEPRKLLQKQDTSQIANVRYRKTFLKHVALQFTEQRRGLSSSTSVKCGIASQTCRPRYHR
ncbi:hypothetical protein PR048_005721 [Dryococelus australis]|uniref:Uncharacterized protein n=1 Tax=Dryococelus australis TaxID=614101 RepID=A0ABQ9IB51_9NEOP|nr:hypothetical protein PR048_005721 [Dryococelus australis]